MHDFILSFDAIGSKDLAIVGGKGANLGELARAGFPVPPGFCVTTAAYRRFVAGVEEEIYRRLASVRSDDLDSLRAAGRAVRELLDGQAVPPEVETALLEAWREFGADHAYAVRSSATAEDLPHASFAGQQETYLNVRGREALLGRVKACWISLFIDRAILYRLQQGIDHRHVALAVVVQRMVMPEVSGILFTADPVTGNRRIISIDASFGLGEALVSGVVSADLYQVDKRTQQILTRRIATKTLLIRPRPEGGTERLELPPKEQRRPALSDDEVLELARIGSRIEAHFGTPQDVEWALADGIYILQSRPITTLFPLPEPRPDDDALHVYVSLSHFQMMTDAMPPMSISLLRAVLPIGHAGGQLESRRVQHAAGRLYADVSPLLRHPVGKRIFPRAFRNADPLGAAAVAELAERPELHERGERFNPLPLLPVVLPYALRVVGTLLWGRPEGASERALQLIDERVAAAKERLGAVTGVAPKLEQALAEARRILPTIGRWAPQLVAGAAAALLLKAVLGNVGDPQDIIATGRGLRGNIVTEMNLLVGDLADLARASKPLAELLQRTDLSAQERLERAAELPGGPEFLAAWQAFLERFGARGPAEIDISRPRWAEDPTSLLQMVVSAMQHEKPGQHREHFERLERENEAAAERLIAAAHRGFWGWLRGPLVRRLLRVSRQLTPLREHHKYYAMRVMMLVKQVLLEAGEQLQAQEKLRSRDDIWFLTLPETLALFGDPAFTLPKANLQALVGERREALAHHQTLTPPRVITSDGEVPVVKLQADAPPGALIGASASAGVAEGRARVVLDPSRERLEPGEILVAPFTDPGWTPLFVNAAGLVTEVGGLMTHGSVVAREYGIPAVVGVVDATKKIRTGQRIRVDGNGGFVEILDEAAEVSGSGEARPTKA